MTDRDPQLAFHTVSGRSIWPTDPRPGDEFLITDIATGLSNGCRYVGQMEGFYSGAQHSIFVSRLLPSTATADDRLWALLHDAHEAYLGDWSRPLIAALPKLKILEDRLLEPIVRSFGLAWPMPPIVKQADDWALAIEKCLLRRPDAVRSLEEIRLPAPWPAVDAAALEVSGAIEHFHRPSLVRHLFLQRFEFLQLERIRAEAAPAER